MEGKHAFTVGVSGGSAAGKTTVAGLLARELAGLRPLVIGVDRYFLDRSGLSPEEREKVNYDVPEALDFAQLAVDLRALSVGESVMLPTYDYATHTSLPRSWQARPSGLIIVEGILLFYPEAVRPLLDFRVFVDAEREERLRRRIARDTAERGRTEESVIRWFNERVEPGFEKYTRPTRAEADAILDWNTMNYPAIDEIARRIRAIIV